MSKSMTRQAFLGAFAALFALLMALAMAPRAAFADDLVAAGSVDSAADAYFTVYVSEQTGVDDEGNPIYGEKTAVKSWTEKEFADLAKTKGLAYAYNAGGGKYVTYGTKKYVTLADILNATGDKVKVGETFTYDGKLGIGDNDESPLNNGSLMNKKGDGFEGRYLSFKDGVESNEQNANEDVVDYVPVFALSYATSEFTDKTADAAANAKNDALASTEPTSEKAPMFLRGKESKKEVEKSSSIPEKVASITVYVPKRGLFMVRTTIDGGKTTKLAKCFTQEELVALAAKNSGTNYYLMVASNNNTVIATKDFVTLDQVLNAANVSCHAEDKMQFECYDGIWKKSNPTFADCTAENKYFPAFATGNVSTEGALGAPTVLALKYGTATINTTAYDAQAAAESDIAKFKKDYPRWCIGETAEDLVASGLRPGSDFPDGVMAITVQYDVTDLSQATVAVADQAYTGSALTPDVAVSIGSTKLVKDRDYTIAYSDNVNPGTAKVTVTAKDPHYTGTATATFQITKPADQPSPAVDPAVASNINTKTVTAAQIQAAAAAGATSVTLGKNVKSIEAGAFKGTNIKTVTLNTKKLTKKGVKNALKGSKVKTIKVKIKSTKSTKGLKGKALKAAKKYNKKVKALNAKYVKKYKKFFTKANCGKKGVKIK